VWAVDELSAEVARWIFAQYLEGRGNRAIANGLDPDDVGNAVADLTFSVERAPCARLVSTVCARSGNGGTNRTHRGGVRSGCGAVSGLFGCPGPHGAAPEFECSQTVACVTLIDLFD
jgi:hypothetical protein